MSDIHPFACRTCGARITTATARAYGRHCKRCGDAGKVRGPVAQFVPHRTRTFGRLNGVRMTNPFWLYMIGYAGAAYGAYPLVFESNEREHPVWCFRRFGGTRTPVPDRGIVVAIGGEHEDHYDDDFCIYNDVVVFSDDYGGGTEIYGYPREEFQPTDFHTATLVENRIYIVGCLGYAEDRRPQRTPVYVLDLDTMRIEFIPTFGDKPGWVWKHEAWFDADENAIVVRGGEHLLPAADFESEPLPGIYALDLEDRRWTRRDPV